ncbi:MAG: AAA family ATPase [Desulfovibrionaceae bacterium]
MIHTITLEDFLAHKHTVVRLGQGMTVLTGPNNCGKSAVVEGLRCLAQNPAPRNWIRHGAREARVSVELDEGHRITWIRREKSVSYEILRKGGEEPEGFHKLRKGQVPDEVRALLRLDPVELESGREKSVDVHISSQKKPIFLLDDDSADARMAEFFAASTESAHLLAMQKLLKNRAKEAKTEERGLLRRLAGHEAELDRLAPLPGLELRLEEARAREAELEYRERKLPALERALVHMEELERAMARVRRRGGALAALAEPPRGHETAPLAQLLEAVRRFGQNLGRARAGCAALAPLADPPALHDTARLAETAGNLHRTRRLKDACERRARALRLPQEPPALRDETALSGLVERMRALALRAEAQAGAVRECALRLEEHEALLARRMEEMGDCPLCGARLVPGDQSAMGGA